MFVGRAQKQNLVSTRPLVACKQIGGKLTPDKVSKVFDPVNIGDCRCDQMACNVRVLVFEVAPLLEQFLRREKASSFNPAHRVIIDQL